MEEAYDLIDWRLLILIAGMTAGGDDHGDEDGPRPTEHGGADHPLGLALLRDALRALLPDRLRPGKYRFRDFVVCGLPLTALVITLLLILVPILWPLR